MLKDSFVNSEHRYKYNHYKPSVNFSISRSAFSLMNLTHTGTFLILACGEREDWFYMVSAFVLHFFGKFKEFMKIYFGSLIHV